MNISRHFLDSSNYISSIDHSPGLCSASLRICVPVNLSYARLPVSAASCSAPPAASSSWRHCACVEESIQTGLSCTEKAELSWVCRNLQPVDRWRYI